jgi:ketosteroid isomerase-like protein
MSNPLTRFAAVATLAAAFVAPSFASAAELTSAQMANLSAQTSAFFHAVAQGQNKKVMSMVTPDFTATNLAGKSTSAAGLVSSAKSAKLQYSGLTGSSKVVSATTDGTTTTAMVQTQLSANTQNSLGTTTTSNNALHKMVWVKTADGWKLASDKIEKSSTTN